MSKSLNALITYFTWLLNDLFSKDLGSESLVLIRDYVNNAITLPVAAY